MDRRQDTRTLAERLAEDWASPHPPEGQRKRGAKPARRKERGHPLADTRGRVYPHRALAWDLWAPGPALCWGCGREVYFMRQVPGAAIVPNELRVAFADGDEANVSSANLRPSCPACLR